MIERNSEKTKICDFNDKFGARVYPLGRSACNKKIPKGFVWCTRWQSPRVRFLMDFKKVHQGLGAPDDNKPELIYCIVDWWFLHPNYEFKPKELERSKCPRIEEFIY